MTQVSVEDELMNLVGGLPLKHVAACTRYFIEAALQSKQKSAKSSHKVHTEFGTEY